MLQAFAKYTSFLQAQLRIYQRHFGARKKPVRLANTMSVK